MFVFVSPMFAFSTHDQAITGLINAIRQLTAPPITKRRKIGFVIDDE